MKKVNCIRLSFLLGTVFCIGSYYYGYHAISGTYPEESLVNPFTESRQEHSAEEKDTEPVTESALIQQDYEYVIVEEDDYLSVYYADLKTKYMDTDISMDELDKTVQKQIREGKKIADIKELYGFLENYSS